MKYSEPHNPFGGESGFTLMEVLIAVALSSIIMITLFSMFDSVVSTAMHVRENERDAYRDRTLESLLFDDLGSIYVATGVKFSFRGYNGSFLGDDDQFMSFCTSASLSSTGDAPNLSLQRVEYLLKRGREASDIYRRERSFCGITGEWEWVEIPVVRGVAELDVEYLDSFDNAFVTEWGAEKGFPSAVKVSIRYEADDQSDEFLVYLGVAAQKNG